LRGIVSYYTLCLVILSYLLLCLSEFLSFSLQSSAPHPHLHSFPTRRSSDLSKRAAVIAGLVDTKDFLGGQNRGYGIEPAGQRNPDRKSTRLNSSHVAISYAVFCLKKKKTKNKKTTITYS